MVGEDSLIPQGPRLHKGGHTGWNKMVFYSLCLKGTSQQLQESKARPSLRSERKSRGDLEKRHPEGLI